LHYASFFDKCFRYGATYAIARCTVRKQKEGFVLQLCSPRWNSYAGTTFQILANINNPVNDALVTVITQVYDVSQRKRPCRHKTAALGNTAGECVRTASGKIILWARVEKFPSKKSVIEADELLRW